MSEITTRRRRFTVDDYYRIAASGVFSPDERLELRDGEITVMAPMGPLHGACVTTLNDLLSALLRGVAVLRTQLPLSVSSVWEPLPDFVIARPPHEVYRHRHPLPADVLLLIEISDSTLEDDRAVKLPLYAKHGVGECWLVDLQSRTIDVHRDPTGGRYAYHERFGVGDRINPIALSECVIEVADVFG